jgi:ferrous iron transport protein B
VLLSMYLLSVVAAIGAAAVLRRTLLRGPRPTLVLELPPYRLPAWRNLLSGTWQPVRTFLVDAGSVILALTIVLWALLSYPRVPAASEVDAPATRATGVEEVVGDTGAGATLRASFMGRLGHAIEPVLEPLGFDWRVGVGILGAFAAREVFVSTLAIVFDVGDADEQSVPLRQALRRARWPDGRVLFSPLAGVSLMVFFVLACQCMSTIAVVRRESGSWRWPALMFGGMTLVAYLASLAVYQGGLLLGWGGV